eukprot:gene4771-9494_t
MAMTSVHIISYLKERVDDINFLKEAIDKLPVITSTINALPQRHRKRRAASFLKYEIPRLLKLNPTMPLLKKRKIEFNKRCRKHRRRPVLLLSERSPHIENNNNTHPYWLETHIWHAKRMKMKTAWGFSLALYHRARGLVAVGKFLKKHSVIHDSSYFRTIQLSGSRDSILQLLKKYTDPQASFYTDETFLNGMKEMELLIYRNSAFPRDCLGPGYISINPSETNTGNIQIWLWCHPAYFDTLLTSIKQELQIQIQTTQSQQMDNVNNDNNNNSDYDNNNSSHDNNNIRNASHPPSPSHPPSCISRELFERDVKVEMVSGGLIRFQIRGKGSTELLKRVCTPVSSELKATSRAATTGTTVNGNGDNDDEEISRGKLLQRILHHRNVSSIWHDDYTLGVRVRDVRQLRFRSSSSVSTENPSVPAAETETDHRGPIAWPTSASKSSLWDVEKRFAATKLISRRITKVGSVLQFHNKENITTDKDEILSIPIILIRKKSHGTTTSMPSYTFTNHRSAVAPWHRRTYSSMLSGWDVIAPSAWGSAIWQALVFAGGRAIGLKEMEAICLEGGRRSFPRDFPDSKAGKVYWRDRCANKEKKQKRNRWQESKVHVNWKDLLVDEEEEDGDGERFTVDIETTITDESNNMNDTSHIENTEKGTLENSSILCKNDMKMNMMKTKKKRRTEWGATGFVVVCGTAYTTAFLVPTRNIQDNNWSCPLPLPLLAHPTLIGVRLWVIGRGVLEVGATILAPTCCHDKDDTYSVNKNSNNNYDNNSDDDVLGGDCRAWMNGVACYHKGAVNGEGAGKRRVGFWRGIEYSDGTVASSSNGGRKHIGFISSGGVSRVCGTAIGVGLCHAGKLHEIQRKLFEIEQSLDKNSNGVFNFGLRLSALVMFRNPNSLWCRPAYIELI